MLTGRRRKSRENWTRFSLHKKNNLDKQLAKLRKEKEKEKEEEGKLCGLGSVRQAMKKTKEIKFSRSL